MRCAVPDRHVELSLPAQSDMMLLVRLAASGVLTRSGVTVDRLDDFKMAVEEACHCLIGQMDGKGRIALRFDPGQDQMTFTCSREGICPYGQSAGEEETEVALCILRSLSDSVDIEREENGAIRSIRLLLSFSR